MHKENQKLPSSRFRKQKDTKLILEQNLESQQQGWKLNSNSGYKLYMRYLIASNAEYFQAKVGTKQVGKPRDIKFKIPSQTGVTIYRKDFKRKKNKFNSETGIKHDMSVDCIKTNTFLKDEEINLNIDGKTTYQQQFKYHNIKTQHHRRFQKRVNTHEKENYDIPRFLQTQNKTDFLNWAGKNFVPSMKPQHKSAATNLPFDAKSVYQSDFQGKKGAPALLFIRQPSLPKFGTASQMMKTSYSNDFTSKKRELIETDCRPKHSEVSLCKHLKGTTEYKRQFIGTLQSDEKVEECSVPTLNEIQTLIIDL